MKFQYRTPTNHLKLLETSIKILFILSNLKPIYQKKMPLCIISRIDYRQYGNEIRVIEVQYKFTSYKATRTSNTSSFIRFSENFGLQLLCHENKMIQYNKNGHTHKT